MPLKVFVATLVATFLIGLALWRPWEERRQPVESPPTRADRRIPPTDDPPVTPVPAPPAPSSIPTKPPAPSISPEEIRKIHDAIDNLELTLRDFGTALGGNPVGTNAEITAALLGDNTKQVKLEIPTGSTLSASGELCDIWGSPWFFHQLSATKTELRSAGPDRQMYTDDDFVR